MNRTAEAFDCSKGLQTSFLEKFSQKQFFQLKNLFLKNLNLMKNSMKPKITSFPNKNKIKSIFCSILYSRKKNHKKKIKCFFEKPKILLIWLISLFEKQTKSSFENFKQKEWEQIASFFPDSEGLELKYKWFSLLASKKSNRIWTSAQDHLLKEIMKKFYPEFYEFNITNLKISWSQISFEFCEKLLDISDAKTDKQCKERWFNHLNPFINKNNWSLDEDIKLIKQNIISPKKWAEISRNFLGRNQHQIKNRFFTIASNALKFPRNIIRKLLKTNSLNIYQILEILQKPKLIPVIENLETASEFELFPMVDKKKQHTHYFEEITEFNENVLDTKKFEETFNIDGYINFS